MSVMVFLGIQLTSGLVPSNLARNTGTIVVPLSPAPGSSADNLQLQTFGFITSTPPPDPTPLACSEDDIKNPPSCGACPTYEAVACDPAPDPCDFGAFIMDLPADDEFTTNFCIHVKNNDEAKYNEKLNDPKCQAACVSRLN